MTVRPVSRARRRALRSQPINPSWARGKTLYTYGRNGVQVNLGGVFAPSGVYVLVKPKKRTSFTFRQGVDLVLVDQNGGIIRRVRPCVYAIHYKEEDLTAVKHFGLSALPPVVNGGPTGRPKKGVRKS